MSSRELKLLRFSSFEVNINFGKSHRRGGGRGGVFASWAAEAGEWGWEVGVNRTGGGGVKIIFSFYVYSCMQGVLHLPSATGQEFYLCSHTCQTLDLQTFVVPLICTQS